MFSDTVCEIKYGENSRLSGSIDYLSDQQVTGNELMISSTSGTAGSSP
jgi:hypothetical protein